MALYGLEFEEYLIRQGVPQEDVYKKLLLFLFREDSGISPSIELMQTYGHKLCWLAKQYDTEYRNEQFFPYRNEGRLIYPDSFWLSQKISEIQQRIRNEYRLEARLHRLNNLEGTYVVSFHPLEGWNGEGARCCA